MSLEAELVDRVKGLLVVETTPGYEDLLIRETAEIAKGIRLLAERGRASERAARMWRERAEDAERSL